MKTSLSYFRLLFLLTLGCVPFAWLAWNHGHHPSDDGFLLGYSWRVWNGQIPYRDFMYFCPPLSPILHAFWFSLGHDVAFKAARFSYFAEMILTASLWGHWAIRYGGIRPTFTALGAIVLTIPISLHAFPVMPWYTVDGILFASLGAYGFLKSRESDSERSFFCWRGLAALAFALSGLTKQSFFPLTFALWAVTGYELFIAYRGNQTRVVTLALTLVLSAIPFVATIVWLRYYQAWGPFLTYSASYSNPRSLLQFGLVRYGRAFSASLMYAVAGVAIARASRGSARGRALAGIIFFAALATMFGRPQHLGHLIDSGFPLYYFIAGMAVAEGWHAWRSKELPRSWGHAAALGLLIGWCTSISLGWGTPLLAAAALMPIALKALPRQEWPGEKVAVLAGVAAIYFLFIDFQNKNAYRDVPRAEQRYDLSEIYPSFGRLYVSHEVYEDYKDLKALSARLGSQGAPEVVMFEGFPLFTFLENRVNSTDLDWYQDSHAKGLKQHVIRRLFRHEHTYVVPKVNKQLGCEGQQSTEHLTRLVVSYGRLVASSPRFCAYVLNSTPRRVRTASLVPEPLSADRK